MGRKSIVGERIWLEYFDQNFKFKDAFTPQYCTIVRQFVGMNDGDDWYLVELKKPLQYEGANYDHLLISSRWAGHFVGEVEPTAVIIMLAPEPEKINNPFELDRSLYTAWGFAANNKEDI